MAWYWIIAIIIGYFILGSTLTALAVRFDIVEDNEEVGLCIVFWPIYAPVRFMFWLCAAIYCGIAFPKTKDNEKN